VTLYPYKVNDRQKRTTIDNIELPQYPPKRPTQKAVLG
jgi:hypothetical protein